MWVWKGGFSFMIYWLKNPAQYFSTKAYRLSLGWNFLFNWSKSFATRSCYTLQILTSLLQLIPKKSCQIYKWTLVIEGWFCKMKISDVSVSDKYGVSKSMFQVTLPESDIVQHNKSDVTCKSCSLNKNSQGTSFEVGAPPGVISVFYSCFGCKYYMFT